MKDYCTDSKACRHALLLAYFGERFAAERCERCCDNCLARQQGSAPVDDLWLVSRPTVVSLRSEVLAPPYCCLQQHRGSMTRNPCSTKATFS